MIDNKQNIQNIFLFALFAILFVLALFMLKPFMTVLLWTILLYILLRPLYRKCLSKINREKKFYQAKRHLLAIGFSVGTLLLIIGPLIFLFILLAQQSVDFLQTAEAWLRSDSNTLFNKENAQKLFTYLQNFGLNMPEANMDAIKQSLIEFLHSYSDKLFAFGKTVINKAGSFIISLVMTVFALYFFFLDGSYLTALTKHVIPIKTSHMNVLTQKFAEIVKNLFHGYILVAIYQGIAALLIMLIFKVPSAVVLSVALMLASFIPLIGSAAVWLPVGIVLCVSRSVFIGILFMIFSALTVGLLDNILRPVFLRDRIHVHPLVIFFAILGGIQLFGLNGLILGPLIIILLFTVLDLMVTQDNWTNSDEQNNSTL
ncbi:MAG: AI-2E family transporter [Treponema sp.]|nr:AI-2E family transporter [Treponema sp.]